MNTIDKIDDITLESQIDVLLTMESSITKQFIMETYYMEEETNKLEEKTENVGEAPNVDGVNALQRFWNWVKRCIYVIRTKISHFFASKKIEKTLKQLREYEGNKKISIPKNTYDEIKRYVQNKDVRTALTVNGKYMSYDSKNNYKTFADRMEEKSKLTNRLEYSEKHSPEIDTKDRVDVSANELIHIFEQFKDLIKEMRDNTVETESAIRKTKSELDDETVKSANFQQFVRWMTFVMKRNLYLIKEFSSWMLIINMIDGKHGQEIFKSYDVSDIDVIDETTSNENPFSSKNGGFRKFIKYADKDCAIEWVNSGDSVYIEARKAILKDFLDKYPLSKYTVLIVYQQVPDSDKWIARKISTPKDNGSEAVLNKLMNDKKWKKQKDAKSGGYRHMFIVDINGEFTQE